MGFACPVCEIPQQDDEHLANHLALTALLHGDDHEDWLNEHVPNWSTYGPDDLAELVVDHAPDADFTPVFEDTTTDHDSHGIRNPDLAKYAAAGMGHMDPEAKRILEEAHELTKRMYRSDDSDDTNET